MTTKDKVWVGFDLGGTKMYATVFDQSFTLIGSARVPTQGYAGQTKGLKRMISTVNDALKDAGVNAKQVGAIGVGCPGPIDLKKGMLMEAPNLGWSKVPVSQQMGEAFDCPVTLMNDVDAGVFGESRFGAGKGDRCLLGIFPGTGIGAGCVYDGAVFHGTRNTCMELGHLRMQPGKSLEQVASRLAIASDAAAAAYRGEAPWLMENVGTDLREIKSKTLKKSIKAGDEAVEKIVRTAARTVGEAAGYMVNLIAPDRIMLGGGLVEALGDLYLEEVEKAARKSCMPTYRNGFKVSVATLGDDAGAMGAAAWAAQQSEKA